MFKNIEVELNELKIDIYLFIEFYISMRYNREWLYTFQDTSLSIYSRVSSFSGITRPLPIRTNPGSIQIIVQIKKMGKKVVVPGQIQPASVQGYSVLERPSLLYMITDTDITTI